MVLNRRSIIKYQKNNEKIKNLKDNDYEKN